MKRFRLYIDESGDHTYSELQDPSKRYLGLIGLFVEGETYRTRFHPGLEALKQAHFPHSPDEPVILHRKELVNRRGPFWRLRDPERECLFREDLLRFLMEQEYWLILVVIDKKAHIARYGEAAWHPYHYCLTALLERYAGFLNRFNARGDVMAESRGRKEDQQLKAAYQRIYKTGTYFRSPSFFQQALTSRQIKLKPKPANIAGLQVADLLVYPGKQDLLLAEGRIQDPGDVFGKQICQTVAEKYNRRYADGCVAGYGKVFLK